MRPDLSTQLVLAIASQEASAAEFAEIEISHAFNAILKFAELEGNHFQQLIKDPDSVKDVIPERDAVKEYLNGYNISVPDKSTFIRRRLRGALGQGARSSSGQQIMHRSSALKVLCQDAENRARETAESEWRAVHLLEAILASPAPEMAAVLDDARIPVSKPVQETPMLDKYGIDLSKMAAGGGSGDASGDFTVTRKDAVSKVVVEELLSKDSAKILLVEAGQRPAKVVVEGIVRFFASKSAPAAARRKRIIKIKEEASNPAHLKTELGEKSRSTTPEAIFIELFKEAAEVGAVLFIDRFNVLFQLGPTFDSFLKRTLSQSEFTLIAAADAGGYAQFFEQDAEWKRLFQTILIHDIEMPDKL